MATVTARQRFKLKEKAGRGRGGGGSRGDKCVCGAAAVFVKMAHTVGYQYCIRRQ